MQHPAMKTRTCERMATRSAYVSNSIDDVTEENFEHETSYYFNKAKYVTRMQPCFERPELDDDDVIISIVYIYIYTCV